MNEFFRYFFGEGDTQEFALFTLAHIIPIVAAVLVILLIYFKRDAISRLKNEENIRYAMAFALIITDMSYYWRYTAHPDLESGPIENLPIGICAWSIIMSSYMVIGKKQAIFDIVYFWLLTVSLFAVLTPTPINFTGPTRYRYYQFWLEHTLGYIALFYMIFVHKMRPTVRSAVRSYIALAIAAVFAYLINRLLPGANYLYMARPESAPSILDILPPYFPLRLAIMAEVITLMYALAYLPWYVKDRKSPLTETNNIQ